MSRQVVTSTGEITPEAECEYDLMERLEIAAKYSSSDSILGETIATITTLRAQLAAAKAEKAEIRRVFNAEIDCLTRASQKEIESWQNERNHARQDCDEAQAKLATATKALEESKHHVAAVLKDGPDLAVQGRALLRKIDETLRSLTDPSSIAGEPPPPLTDSQCYCDTGNERKACMVRCVNSWNTRGVPR